MFVFVVRLRILSVFVLIFAVGLSSPFFERKSQWELQLFFGEQPDETNYFKSLCRQCSHVQFGDRAYRVDGQGFSLFMVRISDVFTWEAILRLCTLWRFSAADIEHFKRSERPGLPFVRTLAERGYIEAADISRLLEALWMISCHGIAEEVSKQYDETKQFTSRFDDRENQIDIDNFHGMYYALSDCISPSEVTKMVDFASRTQLSDRKRQDIEDSRDSFNSLFIIMYDKGYISLFYVKWLLEAVKSMGNKIAVQAVQKYDELIRMKKFLYDLKPDICKNDIKQLLLDNPKDGDRSTVSDWETAVQRVVTDPDSYEVKVQSFFKYIEEISPDKADKFQKKFNEWRAVRETFLSPLWKDMAPRIERFSRIKLTRTSLADYHYIPPILTVAVFSRFGSGIDEIIHNILDKERVPEITKLIDGGETVLQYSIRDADYELKVIHVTRIRLCRSLEQVLEWNEKILRIISDAQVGLVCISNITGNAEIPPGTIRDMKDEDDAAVAAKDDDNHDGGGETEGDDNISRPVPAGSRPQIVMEEGGDDAEDVVENKLNNSDSDDPDRADYDSGDDEGGDDEEDDELDDLRDKLIAVVVTDEERLPSAKKLRRLPKCSGLDELMPGILENAIAIKKTTDPNEMSIQRSLILSSIGELASRNENKLVTYSKFKELFGERFW